MALIRSTNRNLSLHRPIGVLLLFLLLGYLMIPWLERKMLYFPSRALYTTPAAEGLPFEELRFTTGDGQQLHGWLIPAKKAGVRRGIVFCHGNAGNIADRVGFARLLYDGVDAHVLHFDYRGFGRSSGHPSEPGLYEDALAALETLRARPEVDPERIILFGRSLGGAVAAGATQRDAKVAGLILESSFTSIPAMARAIYPIPGIGALVRTRFDTLSILPTLKRPVLVIHGDRDELIPPRMGEALAKASGSVLFKVPGGRHNDTWALGGPPYAQALQDFVRRAAP